MEVVLVLFLGFARGGPHGGGQKWSSASTAACFDLSACCAEPKNMNFLTTPWATLMKTHGLAWPATCLFLLRRFGIESLAVRVHEIKVVRKKTN